MALCSGELELPHQQEVMGDYLWVGRLCSVPGLQQTQFHCSSSGEQGVLRIPVFAENPGLLSGQLLFIAAEILSCPQDC